jgi:predicted MPP superfamily phosphohydrolase
MNCYIIITGLILLLFIIYGYGSNYACKVTRNEIILDKKKAGYFEMTFAVISDLHGHRFGKKNRRLIRKIRKNKPDVIVITGDMVVRNGIGEESCLDLLRKLVTDYPIYYVPGNHEICLERAVSFEKRVRNTGVYYLDNETAFYQSEKGNFRIHGLTLPEGVYYKLWKRVDLGENEINEYLTPPDKAKINILLAHTPEYARQYAKWGADVVFSGHIHGGILSFWFGGLLSPSLRLFPKYSKGYYQINNTHLYVSRGLGLHHIKLRFFNLPELSFITVKNSGAAPRNS